MDRITMLSAKLDQLIELGRRGVDLGEGSGRAHNPLYDPTAADRMRFPHKLPGSFSDDETLGKIKSIPINKIISPQATIHGKKVRSMKDKMVRGTLRAGGSKFELPAVQRSGSKYIVHDGNHRIAAMLRAGKRVARVLVQ